MSEQCRGYEVDGQPVVVRGGRPLNADEQDPLATIVRAVHAMHTAEEWDEIGRKQAAARERNHARLLRIRAGGSR